MHKEKFFNMSYLNVWGYFYKSYNYINKLNFSSFKKYKKQKQTVKWIQEKSCVFD